MWRGVWRGLALGQMCDADRRAIRSPRILYFRTKRDREGAEAPRNLQTSQTEMRSLHRSPPSVGTCPFWCQMPLAWRFRACVSGKKRRSDGRKRLFRLRMWKSSTCRRCAKRMDYVGLKPDRKRHNSTDITDMTKLEGPLFWKATCLFHRSTEAVGSW
jgi:hypothetical protein